MKYRLEGIGMFKYMQKDPNFPFVCGHNADFNLDFNVSGGR